MDANRAIDALTDSRRSRQPRLTHLFLVLCWLVTIPSLVDPRLYDVLGGIEPRRYPWQLFTAVLEHGWPGFPGIVHLLLNSFLILECGRPCERLLGTSRFAAVGALAIIANALAQTLTEGVNGSSLVIWSWGPPLFVALRWARRQDRSVTTNPSYQRIQTVLVVMYVVVVIAMGGLPFVTGWRGNPLVALVLGNLHHLVATAVGGVCAFVWRSSIERRMATFAS